jgi:hypothetical protein
MPEFYDLCFSQISLAIIYKRLLQILYVELKTQESRSELPFGVRAITALGISAVADTLDYIGAPIFALPVIGDIADGIVMTLLYRLTGSKTSAAVNAIEFIPFIGDFVPTYTLTALIWILRESHKRRSERQYHQIITSPVEYNDEQVIKLGNNSGGTLHIMDNESESLWTRFMRAYAILRSRAL